MSCSPNCQNQALPCNECKSLPGEPRGHSGKPGVVLPDSFLACEGCRSLRWTQPVDTLSATVWVGHRRELIYPLNSHTFLLEGPTPKCEVAGGASAPGARYHFCIASPARLPLASGKAEVPARTPAPGEGDCSWRQLHAGQGSPSPSGDGTRTDCHALSSRLSRTLQYTVAALVPLLEYKAAAIACFAGPDRARRNGSRVRFFI